MDLNTLQALSLMGGGMNDMMAAKTQGLPHINPTNYMTGYEERSAIRQSLRPPQAHGGRIARMVSGAMGMPSMNEGMDPSSVISQAPANAALAPYGMQLPTHTNPFLFFNDQNPDGSSTWAGNHPRVARAVEGAMIGATTPGGMTTGESISNIARTVLGMPGMYRASQTAQMQAPFDMAKQIQGLQDDRTNMQMKLAQAYHLYATGQAALDKPAKPPHYQLYVDPSGKALGYNQDTNQLEAPSGTGADSIVAKPPTFGAKAGGKYPVGVKSQSERMGYDKYLSDGGEVNESGIPKNTDRYQAYVYQSQGRSAGYGTSARKGAGQQMGDVSEADRTALKAAEDDAKRAEGAAKEKIPVSQFKDAADPLAARNAETQRRQSEATAARSKYNRMAASVQAKQPNSKLEGSGQRKTIIHPDGRVEIQ